MNIPSHDERISTFLDDAMLAADRAAFEVELKDNAELQQQVAELRQLRQDMALLPRYSAPADFAQRVVAAAVAAKADDDANIAPARRSQSVRFKTIGRGVITGLVIAASIAILMISAPWLNFNNDPVKLTHQGDNSELPNTSGENNAIAADLTPKPLDIVWSSLPGEGEALVLRIRSPKGFAAGNVLREALAEQGIEKRRTSDTTTHATRVANTYRKSVKPAEGDKSAADALYLEISRAELELALAQLAKPENKLEFVPIQHLALSQPTANGNLPQGAAENTGNDTKANAVGAPTSEFVQELSPRLFVLPKAATPSTAGPVAPNHSASTGNVRVLILVEETE